jgi:predicted Zn finger-like uncharacterized protein
VPTSTKVGVEARVTCVERPSDAVIEALRASLTESGFRTFLRERRECAEAGCFADAMLDWARPDEVPRGWFSSTICGSHDYRQCPPCQSIYRLSNSSAAGQATAVHCEVCGRVLVEWGSSKIWEAELVVRGALVPGRR